MTRIDATLVLEARMTRDEGEIFMVSLACGEFRQEIGRLRLVAGEDTRDALEICNAYDLGSRALSDIVRAARIHMGDRWLRDERARAVDEAVGQRNAFPESMDSAGSDQGGGIRAAPERANSTPGTSQARVPTSRGPNRFRVGTRVRAGDRGNIGTVESIDGEQAVVSFLSKSGYAARKRFDLSELVPLGGGSTTAGQADPEEEPLKLFTIDELRNRPSRQVVVRGILARGEFGVLFGPPGSCKTFLALQLALSVAADRACWGRAVGQGPVVLVLAEGDGGFIKRLDAAGFDEQAVQQIRKQVLVLPEPLNLLDEAACVRFLMAVVPLSPALLVLDTLPRCMVGGDENSARDMGLAADAIRRILKETGAAMLAIHHSGKAGVEERGSSALRGAADMMMRVEREGHEIKSYCSKMKDRPEFPPLLFTLVPVELPSPTSGKTSESDEADGNTSCRIEFRGTMSGAQGKTTKKKQAQFCGRAVHAVATAFTGPVSRADLAKHLRSEYGGRPSTVNYGIAAAIEAGLLDECTERGFRKLTLTERGRASLGDGIRPEPPQGENDQHRQDGQSC